jgi:protein-disulfide isomerase
VSRAEQAAARRRERWVLLAVLAALVVLVVAGGIGLQAWRTGRAPSPVAVADPSSPPATITTGQPVTFGAADAPKVVTVFADFHCPHCAEFHESYGPVLDSARQAGRIRLEVYPMAFIDAGSTAASNAFGCAVEAGFAPGYYAGLFGNPILRWSDDQLLALPEAVGATSTPAFAACVTGRTHAGWVESINAAANQRGVTATPTVLVDGVAVDVSELTPDDLAAKINP